MAKNNHLNTCNRQKLDNLLHTDAPADCGKTLSMVMDYARSMALIENTVVVVSDMADRQSHIIAGGFADRLGISDYEHENSIWESRILSLMSPEEQETKYFAELRFFHFLRHLPKSRRPDYFMASKLRFRFTDGSIGDVLHRMYYIFDRANEAVRYAICVYGPLLFDFKGKSRAINSVTGLSEELTSTINNSILSRRECQVLSLIDTGMKSAEIARQLNISIHTVSRHRQEIIGKLQVKNSHEACRIVASMGLI